MLPLIIVFLRVKKHRRIEWTLPDTADDPYLTISGWQFFLGLLFVSASSNFTERLPENASRAIAILCAIQVFHNLQHPADQGAQDE